MLCQLCKKNVPDEMKAVIAMNLCPFCGKSLMTPQMIALKSKLSYLITQAVAKNAELKVLNSAEAVESLAALLTVGVSDTVEVPLHSTPSPELIEGADDEIEEELDISGLSQDEAYEKLIAEQASAEKKAVAKQTSEKPSVPDHMKARAPARSFGRDGQPFEPGMPMPGTDGDVSSMSSADLAGLAAEFSHVMDAPDPGGGYADLDDASFFASSVSPQLAEAVEAKKAKMLPKEKLNVKTSRVI